MKGLLARLLLLVSIALVPVLGFQVYSERDARQVRQQFVTDEARRILNLLTSEQERIAESVEEVLNTISATPAVRENIPDLCQRLLTNLVQQSPRYASAAVIGLDGHLRCAPGTADPSLDLSDRADFRRALQTGGFAIGEYLVTSGTERPTISMAKPFRNQDGVVGGVVVVALSIDWLARQFERHTFPPGAVALVTDSNGIVLAHSPSAPELVGHPMPNADRFTLEGNQDQVVETMGENGRSLIVAYSPPDADPRGVLVFVGLDQDVTFASVIRANRMGLMLIVAGGGLALVMTGLVGMHLIRRPFNRLLVVAERWRTGDLAARSGLHGDTSEFGRLALAFDSMAEAQEAREQALRAALESTTDSVIVLDRSGHLIFLNANAKALVAQGRDLLGKVIWDAFPRLSDSPFGVAYRKAMEGGVPMHVDGYATTFGKHFEGHAYPSRDNLTVFFRDVTEERRTAAALVESEQHFRATFEQAAVGMAQIGLDGTWLRVNDKICAITGYTREELLALTFQDITHADDLDADLANVRALLAGEITTFAMEKRYLCKDGGTVWVNLTVALLRDAAGRPDRFVSVVEDISERKRMEAALQASEARLRAVLDQIPAAVAIHDISDGGVVIRSRHSGTIFGPRDAAMLSNPRAARRMAEHPDGRPYATEEYPSWRALYRDETVIAEPMLYRRTDGRLMDLEIYAAPVRDAAGATIASVVAAFDVSDRKRAERLLAQSHADLEDRVCQEVEAREAAQARAVHAERMQALGQLAGGIAHDFNNVLQSVEGAAALIERRPRDEEAVRRLARLVTEAAGRGASITRRLLAFGRRGDLHAEALDVAVLLTGMHDILAHTLSAAIEVTVLVADDVSHILADKGQLETALVNLATNARDAMPTGGRLTLSADAEIVPPAGALHPAGLAPGRYVRLSVADTGAGMDASTLARASEPFFTTKPLGAGTGLGLPMARGFAEQSGGALIVTSSPGIGTTVTMWLPEATLGQTASAAAPADPEDVPRERSKPPTAARVLVVDDEDLLRDILAEQLDDAGFSVLVAASGAEALALIAAGEAVDLLITDLSMPGMDGQAVIRAAQERRPGLPAVLLTGYSGDTAALAVGGAVTGSFSMLRKPVRIHELVDRVEALLAARASPRR